MKVKRVTTIPLTKLNGHTQNKTNVNTLLIDGTIAAPIPIMVSSGKLNNLEYIGIKTRAFIKAPATIIHTVPTTLPINALLIDLLR